MGPEVMLISAIASAGATALGAVGQSQAMNAQADADQRRADIEAQWTDRRAKDERAAAQRGASEEVRKARLTQSRLKAVAGGSGGGQDGTVMDLWGDIEKEGQYNASQVTTAGEQRATGMNYQAALDQWGADANARIKRSGAKSTLIGGLVGAAGQGLSGFGNYQSGMAARYGGSSAGRTGYG